MKKLFMSAFLAVTVITVNAQISQGTIYAGVGSNINYSSTNYDGFGDNENSFNLDLSGGYFINDGVMLGLGIGYSSYSFGNSDGSATSFQVFGRYYITNFFLGAGYQSYKIEGFGAINQLLLQGGYAAFITNAIAIEPSINYGIGLGDLNANTLSLNVGFGIYINR